MVRLKVLKSLDVKVAKPSFNSTMVRLKGFRNGAYVVIRNMFQFHNGSIKRHQVGEAGKVIDECFNSTMVRLKVGYAIGSVRREARFQFHNGSIKSRDGLKGFLRRAMFQFHNGSIKRGSQWKRLESQIIVSIPQWFD